MARLLTAGFETGSVQELNGVNNGLATVSTAHVRTGSYSLQLFGGVVAGGTARASHVFDADETEIYFRLAWYLDANGISSYPNITFGDNGGSAQLTLVFNGPTQSFKLYRGGDGNIVPGVLIASGTIVLRAETWYLLEGHIVIGDAAGDFSLKVNAVTDSGLSFSGDTQATAATGIRSIGFFGPLGGGLLYIDDLAVNDTSGSFENSYPGLGGIFFLKANDVGATQEFTPSAGSDHDALVDDVPANTTDWVQGVAAGDLELFGIEDTPTYVTQINVVQPVFQAAVAVSGSNELRDVVRADSVDYPGSTTHTIISIAPTYVLYRGETYYEQPDGTSGAFDAAALDALQVGVEIPA